MEDKDLLIKYVNVNLLQSEVIVLKDVNLSVVKGEFIYLIGKVGSGKSTLLKSFYAEVPIASGEQASIFEYNLKKIKRSKIPYLRRNLGIIYQDFQLLTDRTIHDNLMFVLKATGWKKGEALERIQEVLRQVGMENKGYKMPHQLSGGEQQRIVIARALLNKPKIILADEPTGNLDPETGEDIVRLLHKISQEGTTVIMSTHNLNWLKLYPGRILKFADEHLIDDNNDIENKAATESKETETEEKAETAEEEVTAEAEYCETTQTAKETTEAQEITPAEDAETEEDAKPAEQQSDEQHKEQPEEATIEEERQTTEEKETEEPKQEQPKPKKKRLTIPKNE